RSDGHPDRHPAGTSVFHRPESAVGYRELLTRDRLAGLRGDDMGATRTAPANLGSGMRTPGDHVIVLFGATGALARLKLLPALYRLDRAGLMPARYRIVGTSRRGLSDEAFRAHARAAVAEFGRRELDREAWDAFAAGLSYASSDAADASALADAVERAK